MKVGIVITVHNRPELTRQTLESLAASDLSEASELIIFDDGSTCRETIGIINEFDLPKSVFASRIIKPRNNIPYGIKRTLNEAFKHLFYMLECDVVTNLDNDVLLQPNWLYKLLNLHDHYPNKIITGFDSTTLNKDGSERHPILSMFGTGCLKRSCGGINMLFNKQTYETFIRPALEMPVGNWDHEACKLAGSVICATPSVIQHTGTNNSSMNHQHEHADTADGFGYTIVLPEVTLIGVDCNHFNELANAAQVSMRNIKFGHVRLLTSDTTIPNKYKVQIPALTSKEAYNEFIMRQLYKYVTTPYMLIIQGDGYVLNHTAWSNEFYQYDYIGATWVYKDGMNVGNGGFSFRSRNLMHSLALTPGLFPQTYPEDHQICRTYRPLLERSGFSFAPEEVANRFSIEAYGCNCLPGANKYTGQFGFHGWNVDYTDSNLNHIPRDPRPQTIRHRRRGVRLNNLQ